NVLLVLGGTVADQRDLLLGWLAALRMRRRGGKVELQCEGERGEGSRGGSWREAGQIHFFDASDGGGGGLGGDSAGAVQPVDLVSFYLCSRFVQPARSDSIAASIVECGIAGWQSGAGYAKGLREPGRRAVPRRRALRLRSGLRVRNSAHDGVSKCR